MSQSTEKALPGSRKTDSFTVKALKLTTRVATQDFWLNTMLLKHNFNTLSSPLFLFFLIIEVLLLFFSKTFPAKISQNQLMVPIFNLWRTVCPACRFRHSGVCCMGRHLPLVSSLVFLDQLFRPWILWLNVYTCVDWCLHITCTACSSEWRCDTKISLNIIQTDNHILRTLLSHNWDHTGVIIHEKWS